jgi:uncharacterized protein
LSRRRRHRRWRRAGIAGLSIVGTVLALELVYRIVALPPDYRADQQVAASPASEVAPASEQLMSDPAVALTEEGGSELALGRRLDAPPRREVALLPLAPAASAGAASAKTSAVVAAVPDDPVPGLRLNRRIEAPLPRVPQVLVAAPATGEPPIPDGPTVAAVTQPPPAFAAAPVKPGSPAAGNAAPLLPAAELSLVALPVVPRRPPLTPDSQDQPLVAIIIDDMGYSPASLGRLAAMPGPLTLAFLPYADSTPSMLEVARMRDFELLLHLPMEPLGDANPGPEALLVDLDEAELRRRVRWAISQVPGAIGVNNHMGSRFSVDPRGLEIVMEELREARLYFVDSRTHPASLAERVARHGGVPATSRDIFIDHDPTPAGIARQLVAIERFARYHGSVVAIGHPYPTTLDALATWLPTLAGRGFRLARLSEVLAQRLCAGALGAAEPCGPALQLIGYQAGAPAGPAAAVP